MSHGRRDKIWSGMRSGSRIAAGNLAVVSGNFNLKPGLGTDDLILVISDRPAARSKPAGNGTYRRIPLHQIVNRTIILKWATCSPTHSEIGLAGILSITRPGNRAPFPVNLRIVDLVSAPDA